MKNKLLIFGCLFTLLFNVAVPLFGQQCQVERDSIIAGDNAGIYTDYIYDGLDRLHQTITRDEFSEYNASIVTYDAQTGLVAQVKTVDLNDTARYTKLDFVINPTTERVERINAYGQDSTGANVWTMSHDVSYSGGHISSIVLDTSSLTGNPDGFTGSFTNMMWQNGNVTSLTLTVGTDMLDLTVNYDNKNNIRKKLLNTDGASGIFQAQNANNLLTVETSAPGTLMGNSVATGTKLLENQYTYNSNNDVVTVHELPALLDNTDRTTKYLYDCMTSIKPSATVKVVDIYPNPANEYISVENGYFSGTVSIFNLQGKEVRKMVIDEQLSELDVSGLLPGMYYIEIKDGQHLYGGKILKN